MRKLKSSAGTFSLAEMTDLKGTAINSNTLSGVDMNNVKTPGVYYFANDVTNLPAGIGGYGMAIVLKIAGGSAYKQIVSRLPDKIYVRNYAGESWTEWYLFTGESLS